MKRLKITGLLSAALFLFVMSGTAQTKEDVSNAYNAGVTAARAKDYGKAVESFQQAIDLGTKVGADADSLRKVAESRMAQFQFQYAYGISQNKASTNADILGAFQKAKDLAEKYGDAAMSAKVDGVMPTIYLNMAFAAFSTKDYTGALANFDKVIALDPSETKAYYGKAVVYKNQNAFDPMVQAFTKTIEVATKSADTATVRKSKQILEQEYLTLANASYLKKDYKGTLAPLTEVFKYDNKNTQAYYILAVTKNGLKDPDGALEAVSNGLKYENPAAKELVARFYYEQGVAYSAKGDKDKAVASFKLASVGKYAPAAAAYIKGLTAKPGPAPAKK